MPVEAILQSVASKKDCRKAGLFKCEGVQGRKLLEHAAHSCVGVGVRCRVILTSEVASCHDGSPPSILIQCASEQHAHMSPPATPSS